MTPRVPIPPEVLSADGGRLYPLLNEGSDFTVVIVALSYLDACLTTLLSKYFRKSSISDELLDANKGALSTLTSKTNLAYVLGLIDKPMLQDLIVLARLRNLVAHSHFELAFHSNELQNLCGQLKYIAQLKDADTGNAIFDTDQYRAPRNKFILTAITLWNRMLLTALETKHAA